MPKQIIKKRGTWRKRERGRKGDPKQLGELKLIGDTHEGGLINNRIKQEIFSYFNQNKYTFKFNLLLGQFTLFSNKKIRQDP